jgi:hypothetical protein
MLIDIKDATKTTAKEFDEEAISLHEWSDAWEKIRNHKESPDNSERIKDLEQELLLAEKINATRGT